MYHILSFLTRFTYFILISFLVYACLPVPTQTSTEATTAFSGKKFLLQDHVYEPYIKTVLLYPSTNQNNREQTLEPPVIFINQTQPLVLEFDVLKDESEDFRVKIVHCNYDWKLSLLNDIEFLNAFNNFQIRDYDFSINTRIPYVHYRFELPRLKVTGNYVLKVFRDGDEDDLILTRRFVVYDNRLSIQPVVKFSNENSLRKKNQQIEFEINYNNYEVTNPRNDLRVVIRQNYRWDATIDNLLPTSVREFDKKLLYQHFNLENNFPGLNEFRRFELKSTRFLGLNITDIRVQNDTVFASVYEDESRAEKPYVRRPDMNGRYLVEHYETGRGPLEGEYVSVLFTLSSEELYNSNVYVMGAYNLWATDSTNQMVYREPEAAYQAAILMKQGEYNYAYGVKLPDKPEVSLEEFEGYFQDTENDYEIIVYHRPLGARADQVVAYTQFDSNDAR